MKLTGGQIVRLVFIALLWAVLCVLMIATQPFTLSTLFWVVASGVVVFVPLYKKYVRDRK